jgi:hypothetical protein
MEQNFDEIRPYHQSEINAALRKITSEEQFMTALAKLMPDIDKEALKAKLNSFTTTKEFQGQIVFPITNSIIAKCSTGISIDGLEYARQKNNRIYISNHRDIVLDPLLLGVLFFANDIDTPEVAIGNNLFVTPWMEPLVRINKNIVVKRNVPVRQMLEVSSLLSAYIRYAICEKKSALWIAQREGRAKDANDRTQESLLKMLNISGKDSFKENFLALNLSPLTICYEYDPCDYLKAKEFQLKRDNPQYKKTPQDDAENMLTGIFGWKGEIKYVISSLDDELNSIPDGTKNEQFTALARLIDKHIHRNYKIFANNRVAYDLLMGENRFANEYTAEDKNKFETYLQERIAKIDILNKDESFLRTKILEMYANPLKNKLEAIKN